LLFGYGEIGRRLKKSLEALDINLRIVSKSAQKGTTGYSRNHLREMLSETDILMLAVPLTAETEGLIGKEELGAMPSGSLLVNISRGGIVVEKALYEALKSGHLFGAGLDVWYQYPEDVSSRQKTYPGQYPFHELDNLVLSPHRAGLVKETEKLRMGALARLLNQAAEGKLLDHSVDLDMGY
jgi:phosphoglycerate dehydrogenase-like enzyme